MSASAVVISLSWDCHMPSAIHLVEIEMHGCSQFIHTFTLSIKSSNKKEHRFIKWPLVLLYTRLKWATGAPTLPVCTDRGAVLSEAAQHFISHEWEASSVGPSAHWSTKLCRLSSNGNLLSTRLKVAMDVKCCLFQKCEHFGQFRWSIYKNHFIPRW